MKNKCGQTIECVTIDTSCKPPLAVGTVYGSFTPTGFHHADCPPPTTSSYTKDWSWLQSDDWTRWSR